jgi:hypothetical protein
MTVNCKIPLNLPLPKGEMIIMLSLFIFDDRHSYNE